jgi:hypothetical protein
MGAGGTGDFAQPRTKVHDDLCSRLSGTNDCNADRLRAGSGGNGIDDFGDGQTISRAVNDMGVVYQAG